MTTKTLYPIFALLLYARFGRLEQVDNLADTMGVWKPNIIRPLRCDPDTIIRAWPPSNLKFHPQPATEGAWEGHSTKYNPALVIEECMVSENVYQQHGKSRNRKKRGKKLKGINKGHTSVRQLTIPHSVHFNLFASKSKKITGCAVKCIDCHLECGTDTRSST